MDNYTLLINKLDAFIRKYYINQLLRGSLYAVGVILGLFILFNVLEYNFYFSTGVRKVLFWSFVLVSAGALYAWVLLPLLHYFRLGKIIDHQQAATIVGDHFTNVQDKLLNILQLKQQSNNALYADLIHASIDQKSEEIRLVPFQAAIDLGKNRKYLKYALPPLLLLIFLLIGAPNILREGTKRLIRNNETFERPAPFAFGVETENLKVLQFDDYQLKVQVDGEALPAEVFIDLGGKVQYRLEKESPNTFTYKFTNVQRNTPFSLFAGEVQSKDFTLEVLAKPAITSFDVRLDYPDYTGRADESIANIGDLVVPQGTRIRWVFDAQHTDDLLLTFGNTAPEAAKQTNKQVFSFERRIMQDEAYKVFIRNQNLPNGDSVAYALSVIPDLVPEISVEEFPDSTNAKVMFFAGDAADDYGISNLTFNYQIKKAKGGQQALQSIKLKKPEGKQANCDYMFDTRPLDLQAGDEVTYYFEVFDNDAVNGVKSSRTAVQLFKLPSLDELQQANAENSEEINKDLKKALEESRKLQEELKKLRDKALQQKELDWQTKKEMEKLLNRQKQINQFLQQAEKNFEQNKQNNEQLQKSEQLQQQEQQLEKMFQEALDPESQKLMEELQKLLEEMNKEEALEKMEEMDQKNESLQKEMERLEELYKQMEVNDMLEQQMEKLEEMAEKLEELSEKTEKNAEPQEELEKKQEEINKEFEQFQKDQKELEKKNEELKKPKDVPKMDEQMEETEKELDQAEESLEKKDNPNAAKKQKKAANKMKDMAGKMKKDKAGGEMKSIQEDMAMLRQLLENLVTLSFTQESNLKEMEKTTPNTPRYVELVQGQFKIKDDFKIVEDSLHALAMRNASIETFVTDKVAEVKVALKNSVDELEERRKPQANQQQTASMKGLNDLALMLAEAMDNMQQDMSSMMEGSQNCQKPGSGKGKSGKVPMDKITKGQQELSEEMKKAMEKKKGEKPGEQGKGEKPGEKGGQGGQGGMSSEEFAKMAAKQAALRNMVRELQKQKQEQGKGSKALEQLMEEMNKVEVDLVNKRLTAEMMKRQQEILTRLLEEERAEREREQDEKRQAESALQQPATVPPALEEYLKKRRAETEQYRTVSPTLKPFYKRLVEDYWKANQ